MAGVQGLKGGALPRPMPRPLRRGCRRECIRSAGGDAAGLAWRGVATRGGEAQGERICREAWPGQHCRAMRGTARRPLQVAERAPPSGCCAAASSLRESTSKDHTANRVCTHIQAAALLGLESPTALHLRQNNRRTDRPGWAGRRTARRIELGAQESACALADPPSSRALHRSMLPTS